MSDKRTYEKFKNKKLGRAILQDFLHSYDNRVPILAKKHNTTEYTVNKWIDAYLNNRVKL